MRNINDAVFEALTNLQESNYDFLCNVEIKVDNPAERVCLYQQVDGNPFKAFNLGIDFIRVSGNKLFKEVKKNLTATVETYDYTIVFFIDADKLQASVEARHLDIRASYAEVFVKVSMMQEYLASRTDTYLGSYTQKDNVLRDLVGRERVESLRCPYRLPGIYPRAMVSNNSKFTRELTLAADGQTSGFNNDFIEEVVVPIKEVERMVEQGKLNEALVHTVHEVWSADWKLALTEWITRRLKEETTYVKKG